MDIQTMEIEMTVAMPCYNGDKIGWLAMESLCRQEFVNFKWELLVCEEVHQGMLGKEFFHSYIDRLSEVGCEHVVYLSLEDWVNLTEKWSLIGQNMDSNSKIFVLQAIDDYSQKDRLSVTYNEMIRGNYDWIDFEKSYFYSFQNDSVILYNGRNGSNLGIAFKDEYARKIPPRIKNKSVDSHLFKHVQRSSRKFKRKKINGITRGALYTDGYNNISKRRVKFYQNVRHPFIDDRSTLDEIELPIDVVEQIKGMSNGN